ncbi:peptidoglycan DD-metalloendopeptidase family protein [Zhongshania aliphaticivorans]|uniref:peptidoglycan DD-metalloendopeptidase family protein n=1 Tax=Zhongshania aliphaticivorans TaxID=1470434 RepID=UPI0012E557A6|nr:peptidoglycan DD-metalloendopeptidase family protein [Zhongshania aliphaticivorans]CAA0107746.1 Murein hydrolase activator NlpD [Zhongshania aliphaticivorans]
MKATLKRLFSIVVFAISFSACTTSGGSAPVSDRYNPSESPPSYYVVSAGDTLFSIAWRYGFNVKGLATANSLAAPYTIYPGQALVLQESTRAIASVSKPAATVHKPSRSSSGKSVKNAAASVNAPKPAVKPLPSVSNSAGVWRWPVEGPLVRRFVATGQAHKGIDIKGKMGEPVRASKAGVVVYSGSGLVGYGNLLILKHSDRYLSAYGHNRRLLVKEGDSVKAGTVIAELGDSGTDSPKVHFEVRIDGKPVDPLRLLPRR